ncbi:TPA: hypothetical protein G9F26_003953 [Salmonella enterica]|uniref:Uncharacterized protein n=1 Tax=Salmonella enterica TaxID=28901 RepID=A0A750MRA1_SALER|nr:hypothetical protein [Salmonella enterica]
MSDFDSAVLLIFLIPILLFIIYFDFPWLFTWIISKDKTRKNKTGKSEIVEDEIIENKIVKPEITKHEITKHKLTKHKDD